MIKVLRKKLVDAEGRSEFAIIVFCDIRGFSKFSTLHDSSDTAMFIKRFYIKLLNDYFPGAVFAKPTGDGLLVVYRYSEKTLKEASRIVFEGCFRVLSEYNTMFQDDPMVNYPLPDAVGFGVARGPVCCLFSGRTILDYSGALLNLSARLNEYARPSGLVVDGNFLLDVIPLEARHLFVEEQVFVRGIAEKDSMKVFRSSEVSLPRYALTPIQGDSRRTIVKTVTLAALKAMDGYYNIAIPMHLSSLGDVEVEVVWPNRKLKGHSVWKRIKHDDIIPRPEGVSVRVSIKGILNLIKDQNLPKGTTLSLRAIYIEK